MSVVILARVTAAGIQIQAELLVIQTFRAITDSRFKIKAKSTAYLYPEPGEARPGTTGGIT